MTLKRRSPDSVSNEVSAGMSHANSVYNEVSAGMSHADSVSHGVSHADSVSDGISGGMLIGPASSVTYETESETQATAKPQKTNRAGKKAIAEGRFPGVFGGKAASTADDVVAPMESFDKDAQLPSIRGSTMRQAEPGKWEIYTIAELVRFRDEITRHLPASELSKLNLEEEVLMQYHVLRELQADVLCQTDTPANQRAQVANSVASILKTLADQQVELYTSERFKDIENLMVRSLRLLPEETASKFLDEYEQIVRNSERK